MASSTYRGNQPPSSAVPRVFAVLALAVTVAVVVAVVSGSLGGSSPSPAKSKAPTARATSKPKDDYYVVQQGDTFSGIAAHENVSTARLQRLNPEIDQQVLQPQACISVVPDGCKKLSGG
jgi:LysM repeat protein